MSYRILVKELHRQDPPCLPIWFDSDRYIITNLTIKDSRNYIDGSTNLLRSVFPRIFGENDNYFKQFIRREYFDPYLIHVAIERETSTVVSHFGCQKLKVFDPHASVLIYVATDKDHRKKGIMRLLCQTLLAHLKFYWGCDRVYCIPDEGTLISDIYQRLGFVPTSEEFTKKYLRHIQKDLPRDSETSSE